LGLKINKAQFREVKCPQCNAINKIKLRDSSGTMTFFCKSCGEEIHLVFDRTLLDIELEHRVREGISDF